MSDVGAADAGTNDGDLTILLQAYSQGDQRALHLLIDRVYTELRCIAAGRLRGETHNPLMGPTALVNEAYLRLVGGKAPMEWGNRRHFFAAASETMRRILVDQARQRLTCKRGGAAVRQINVGSYRPNAWGIYDMHGNVKEFTATPGRVRGGSWLDSGRNCCSEIFIPDSPSASENVGFRVVLVSLP